MAVSLPTWHNMPASLHREAHVPGLSVYSSHGLTPDSLSSLLACGYFRTRVYAPGTTLCLRSLWNLTPDSCLHILALHLSPQSATLLWIFPSWNILTPFNTVRCRPTLWKLSPDALDFQMFMTNGLTLHLYGLHTFQFLCLYLMIMPFIVFFLAKRRKKIFFFLREATFFIFESRISRHNISKSVDIC